MWDRGYHQEYYEEEEEEEYYEEEEEESQENILKTEEEKNEFKESEFEYDKLSAKQKMVYVAHERVWNRKLRTWLLQDESPAKIAMERWNIFIVVIFSIKKNAPLPLTKFVTTKLEVVLSRIFQSYILPHFLYGAPLCIKTIFGYNQPLAWGYGKSLASVTVTVSYVR